MVYQTVTYFMISRSKDPCGVIGGIIKFVWTKMKKMNCVFRLCHAKKARWGYLLSKFIKHLVKI